MIKIKSVPHGVEKHFVYPSHHRARSLPLTTRGQLFKFSAIAVAFFALLFVHILSYFLFSLSGIADATAPLTPSTSISGTPGDPFIASTLSAYLNTPLFETLPQPGSGMDAALIGFLKDNPHLWRNRTYGEFLTLLASAHAEDHATISTAFSGVTTTLFSTLAPAGKRITLTVSDPRSGREDSMSIDLGTIPELERQLRDLRTADEASKIDDSILREYQTAKDYESFKAQHTSTIPLASLHGEPITISIYILQQHRDINNPLPTPQP